MTSRGVSRRDLLLGAGGAALLAACRGGPSAALRLGFMTNLTHAPVIAGVASGRIERTLGVPVATLTFRSGPRVMEALLGGAIDVGVSGPSAIVFDNARHAPGTFRLLSGCCSGGASFVVSRASGIGGPADLRGKTLASPQIGTTQDISLRTYLRRHGYRPADRGGDVTVTALDSATILAEMRRGALDGAWLAEPWATRVVRAVDAVRLVDERDLWPGRAFPTALVIARGDLARRQPALVARVVDAVGAEVHRAQQSPGETLTLVGDELGRLVGERLPQWLLDGAARFVDFTSDPLRGALDAIADDAFALGLAPRSSSRTLLG